MKHTAGFTHGLVLDLFDQQYTRADVFGLEVNLVKMMSRIVKIPLGYQPETKFVYSVGPHIQARPVEILFVMPFEVLDKRLFKPLGMKDGF